MLCSVQHEILMICVKAMPGDKFFTEVVSRVPVQRVVVAILPGYDSMFALSSAGSDGADEVYLCARDRTARNK